MSSFNNVLSPIDSNVLPTEEVKPIIYRPTYKYKLQDAIGLRDQKQRWLSYLEIMRECLYEKNVNFDFSYRTQKNLVTSQVVRAFKKKAPDFPVTAGDWAAKEMLISTIQRKRYYLNKKKIALTSRPPPAQEVQEEVAQEVQEEIVRQEETRRTREEESPVLPPPQESPLEKAPQNSPKKRGRRGRGRK